MGNILMVANYPSDTAYAWWLMESFWSKLAAISESQGNRVFLSFPKITELSQNIKNSKIETIELVVPWKTTEQKIKIRQFIKENNITCIYFTDQSYFNLKYITMRKNGVRCIINHDHTPGDRPPVRGIKGALKAVRNMLPAVCVDKVFCVSKLMRIRSIENERIPPGKCIVIQNGINPVDCTEKETSKFRGELGVSDNALLICTSGRAHPYKRFDFIINCAASLKQLSPELDFHFVIAGDGPAMTALQKQVNDLDLSDRVKLLGFRKDIHNILCASDIGIHAALGEGFSLAILEYMSAGLPVVIPNIPSVSQAIIDNETGLLYSKNNTDQVAEQILYLAKNKDKRLAMGLKATDEVATKYTIKNCLDIFSREAEKMLRTI